MTQVNFRIDEEAVSRLECILFTVGLDENTAILDPANLKVLMPVPINHIIPQVVQIDRDGISSRSMLGQLPIGLVYGNKSC